MLLRLLHRPQADSITVCMSPSSTPLWQVDLVVVNNMFSPGLPHTQLPITDYRPRGCPWHAAPTMAQAYLGPEQDG